MQTNVLDHLVYVEELVEQYPRREMKDAVEEREQAEHSPKPDQTRPPGDSAQWSDAESYKEEAERPAARVIRDVIDRICAEPVRQRAVGEPCHRPKAGQERSRFENPPPVELGHLQTVSKTCASPYRHTCERPDPHNR